jgi:hypothetical protein
VSHDREVVVLDLDTNAVIGKIPGTSLLSGAKMIG